MRLHSPHIGESNMGKPPLCRHRFWPALVLGLTLSLGLFALVVNSINMMMYLSGVNPIFVLACFPMNWETSYAKDEPIYDCNH